MNDTMLKIVSMLPVIWQPKAKSIMGGIGALAGVVVLFIPILPEWAVAAVGFLTWAGVYAIPAPGYVGPKVAPAADPVVPS